MGSPDYYYKEILKYFAKFLCLKDDEDLEKVILKKKELIDPMHFFYYAGVVSQVVFNKASAAGCDQANAAMDGITEFEYLIGLLEEDD